MDTGERYPLVSTSWLSEHLCDADVRILDVRWRSRYENGRGISLDDHEGYLAGHIPGAVFAGMISDLSDPRHATPDMLASPDQFAEAMGRLGVGGDTLVVTYDNMGFPLGSARLWWALNYYGHDKVRVLDGGLRQWQNEQRPIATDVPVFEAAKFTATPCAGWLATKQDVVASLDRDDTILVDCLTPELYQGRGDRHLWGQRPGHISGAVNVPYLANIDSALASASAAERERILGERRDFTFASSEELADLYAAAGIDRDRKVITYCGRGYAQPAGYSHLGYSGTKTCGFTMDLGRSGVMIPTCPRKWTQMHRPWVDGFSPEQFQIQKGPILAIRPRTGAANMIRTAYATPGSEINSSSANKRLGSQPPPLE